MNVLHNSSQIRYPIGFGQTVLIALVALGLTACSTPPRTKPATITDRSTGSQCPCSRVGATWVLSSEAGRHLNPDCTR